VISFRCCQADFTNSATAFDAGQGLFSILVAEAPVFECTSSAELGPGDAPGILGRRRSKASLALS